MIIEKNLLMNFIKKIRINKRVESCLLDFSEKGIVAKTMDKGKYVFTKVLIKEEYIDNYEPIGEVCVKNLELLENMVKVFTGTIILKVNKNVLLLKNKIKTKTVSTTLASKDLLELSKDVKVPFKVDSFEIETALLLRSVKDVGTVFGRSDDNLKKSEITIKSKGDGVLHIIAKDARNNKVRNSENVQTNAFEIFFSDAIFSDVVSCLTSKTVKLTVEGTFPLKIVESGKIKAIYHIAQRIEDDTED